MLTYFILQQRWVINLTLFLLIDHILVDGVQFFPFIFHMLSQNFLRKIGGSFGMLSIASSHIFMWKFIAHAMHIYFWKGNYKNWTYKHSFAHIWSLIKKNMSFISRSIRGESRLEYLSIGIKNIKIGSFFIYWISFLVGRPVGSFVGTWW